MLISLFAVSCGMIVVLMLVRVMKTMLDTVNHAAGTEEQERLEEGVGQQVEERGHVCPHPDCRHHIAELRDRRVGQQPV